MRRYCMNCLKKDGVLYSIGLYYNNEEKQLTAMKMNSKAFYIFNIENKKEKIVFNTAHAYIMVQNTILQKNSSFNIALDYNTAVVKMIYGKLISIGDFEVIKSEEIINWLCENICNAGLFVECSKKYRRSLPVNFDLNTLVKER